MRIAVFNAPRGVSAEGMVRAFLDAGLSRSVLQREIKKRSADPGTKRLTIRIFSVLERAGIFITDPKILSRIAEAAVAFSQFKIQKAFLRNLAIGKKGNARTLKLLKGFVLNRLPVNREIVTSAGAAILSVVCERERSIPAMELEAVGFGPEGFQVSIGKTVAPYRRERILLLETNIDDMNPQGFELLYERLFKAGALDVWVEPVLMKKMRPAFKLSVLLNHIDQEKISGEIFKETPTLGVRFFEMDRLSLPRQVKRVRTRFGKVRMKFGFLDSKRSVGRPEYEDLKRIARRKNLPFRKVIEAIQTGRP